MAFRARLFHLLGIDMVRVSHRERCLAAIGAGIGIACTWVIASLWLGPVGKWIMLASMGAGAVLLFAVPHGALSQPWAAIGSHVVSAIIGVACAQWIDSVALAAPLAVGLAVFAQHYLRCLHPPGGATSLIPVLAGPEVQQIGWSFVLAPVLLNACTLFLAALVFNNLSGRRYPAALASPPTPEELPLHLQRVDIRQAMQSLDLVEDISEEDLLILFKKAADHARKRKA